MKWCRKIFYPRSVYERRHELSRFWMDQFDGRVRYGPFKGLALGREFAWSSGDLAAKLFGLYEQEVVSALCRYGRGLDVLVDIGASDGFYANGSLVSGLVGRCIAFEADQKTRQILNENARLNGVSDRLTIEGIATEQNIANLISDLRDERALVLIDIEGSEFDLLTENLIQLMRCPILIELHDWMVDDGEVKRLKLVDRLNGSHDVSVLTNDLRDLSGLFELKTKNDDHRWLFAQRVEDVKWSGLSAFREISALTARIYDDA